MPRPAQHLTPFHTPFTQQFPCTESWWLCPPQEFYPKAAREKFRMSYSRGVLLVEQIRIRSFQQEPD